MEIQCLANGGWFICKCNCQGRSDGSAAFRLNPVFLTVERWMDGWGCWVPVLHEGCCGAISIAWFSVHAEYRVQIIVHAALRQSAARQLFMLAATLTRPGLGRP